MMPPVRERDARPTATVMTVSYVAVVKVVLVAQRAVGRAPYSIPHHPRAAAVLRGGPPAFSQAPHAPREFGRFFAHGITLGRTHPSTPRCWGLYLSERMGGWGDRCFLRVVVEWKVGRCIKREEVFEIAIMLPRQPSFLTIGINQEQGSGIAVGATRSSISTYQSSK